MMQLRDKSRGIHKPREKTEYEKMIEIQQRLGIGTTLRTRDAARKIE